MKHMRKALSLLLVLAMVVCFAVPAFAASPEGATVLVHEVHREWLEHCVWNRNYSYSP